MPITKRMLISPSGFPELGPQEAIALRHLLGIIIKNYELAGYAPLETPLVERPDILFAKAEGEITQQVYGLRRLNLENESDDDSKDLALRFDLTVPLARYVAANRGTLQFPFRRYAIGPVFRGERPKDGRYRQFTQADIDVIGDSTLSVEHDAEMVSVIASVFTELAIGDFTVRIGHRKVLQGLLRWAGLTDEAAIKTALRAIDRVEKEGRHQIIASLASTGIEESKAVDLLDFLTQRRTTDETLSLLQSRDLDPLFNEGVGELETVVKTVRMLKVPEARFTIDLGIARGLDYYTGTVYETRFDAHPDLGSIASGGRYENLAGTFCEQSLPGVGISIGVTRLLLRLIKTGLLPATVSTVAPVLVTSAVAGNLDKYLDYAVRIRSSGTPAEVFMQERPLGKQLQHANRRGFKIAVIAFEEDFAGDTVMLRDLAKGEQVRVPLAELAAEIRKMLP